MLILPGRGAPGSGFCRSRIGASYVRSNELHRRSLLLTNISDFNEYWEIFASDFNDSDEFTCFSSEERALLLSKYNISESIMTMGEYASPFALDDWGLASLAAWIILREFGGFNITLKSFYENALDIVSATEEQLALPHAHLEIFPSDFETDEYTLYTLNSNDIVASLNGITSEQFWALKTTVKDEIEQQLGL